MKLAMLLRKEDPAPPLVPRSWNVSPERLEYFMRGTLPAARVLLLEKTPSAATLNRYDEGGAFAGDTWHQNVDDAKHQVEFEYGPRVTESKVVPSDVETVKDLVTFLLKEEGTE